MAHTKITLHLPAYRARALKLQTDLREAEPAYDANIHAYVRYLTDEAMKAGHSLETNHGDTASAYSIDAPDHDAKKAAHDWLDTQPDIWNWIP